MTLISFLGKKKFAVSEKWIVTMATYCEEGNRTKDGNGKNRGRNERDRRTTGIHRTSSCKISLFCLKKNAREFFSLAAHEVIRVFNRTFVPRSTKYF